jgi:long-chain acyl-CoA synthetase
MKDLHRISLKQKKSTETANSISPMDVDFAFSSFASFSSVQNPFKKARKSAIVHVSTLPILCDASPTLTRNGLVRFNSTTSCMNLASAFALSAEKNASKIAVFWGEQELTFSQVAARSRWLANELVSRYQIKPGDRIGLWLKNCPEFVSILFAIFEAGGVVVPVNNFLKPDEVGFILRDAGAKMLFSEQAMAEGLGRLRQIIPGLETFDIEKLHGELPAANFAPVPRVESDLAVIVYTSGTTGHPKGAMLSHGNLLHNVESCRQVLQAVSFDRFVVLLPMFHSFMLCVGILLPMIVGGSMLLIKSVHPPKNLINEIVEREATILPAIPQLFRTLANATIPPNLPLRICISGAAPLPLEVLKEFNEKVPIPLLEGYGLSEASPVVAMNPIQGPWKVGSIGIPVPGVEVTFQDDDGKILAPGEVGELCVRGGNVMQGYWNQPEETAKALRNGWLLTGDVGYKDADGYMYITDRKKDMLLVNGINVYPREIEEIIYQFPGIKEAAVVSKPDPRKGEQPVAFVAAKENERIDEKALIQFVRSKLADYKVPRRIHVLPALPRNATGKILKTTLRDMARATTEAE